MFIVPIYDISLCIYHYIYIYLFIMCGALPGAYADFGSHDVRDKVPIYV